MQQGISFFSPRVNFQCKLQALVYDILPSRRRVPESDARSVCLSVCVSIPTCDTCVISMLWRRVPESDARSVCLSSIPTCDTFFQCFGEGCRKAMIGVCVCPCVLLYRPVTGVFFQCFGRGCRKAMIGVCLSVCASIPTCDTCVLSMLWKRVPESDDRSGSVRVCFYTDL